MKSAKIQKSELKVEYPANGQSYSERKQIKKNHPRSISMEEGAVKYEGQNQIRRNSSRASNIFRRSSPGGKRQKDTVEVVISRRKNEEKNVEYGKKKLKNDKNQHADGEKQSKKDYNVLEENKKELKLGKKVKRVFLKQMMFLL